MGATEQPNRQASRLWPRIRAGWTQLTGTGASASLGLALLVCGCVFICVAAPRASLHNRTAALQHQLAKMPAAERTIYGTVSYDDFETADGGQIGVRDIEAASAELSANLAKARLPLAPARTGWSGLTTSLLPVIGAARSAYPSPRRPVLEIVYRNALPRYSRLVAGRLPTAATVSAGRLTFQSAITTATAARFGLRVGSQLRLADDLTLVVTGIVAPRSPQQAFWTVDPTAAAPLLITGGTQSLPYWSGAAFIGPAEINDLPVQRLDGSKVSLAWDFPLSLGGVTADSVDALRHHVTAALSTSGTLVSSMHVAPLNVLIESGLATDLAAFSGADDAISRLLSLLFVSLTLVGAVVVLLGARLLTEHRHAEFALMRARGAALRQLAGLALRSGAVAVLPAAIIAGALAMAVTPGTEDPLAWWLAGLTSVVALAGPPLMVVRRYSTVGRRGRPRGRESPSRKRSAARRLVVEAALICAATGGLVLLRLQGLPAPGGSDFYLSAAPALVAIPAAVLVVRCYPGVLRALLRLAVAGRGVIGYLGLARGARTSLSAVLPTFALVLALAVIAFGTMVRDAVLRGEVAASWLTSGADAVVGAADSGISLPPRAQQIIASVPGVQRTASILDLPGSVGAVGFQAPVNIAVVDPVRYAAVLAGTPVPPFPAAELAKPRGGARPSLVPVLASPAVAPLLHRSPIVTVGIHSVRVRVAGIIAYTPAMPIPGPFVVFPRWAQGSDQPAPNVMFLAGSHLDGKALKATALRAVPAVTVTLRSDVLAGLRNAPLPSAGYVAFAEGAVAAAAFSVLIMLLTLILGARSRELTLARLSTMGLSQRQGRRLAAVETLPPVLAAAAGGIVCAAVLAPLIGPTLDLSAFTSYTLSVPVKPDIAAMAGTAGGLAVLTLATLAGQAAAARRRGVGRALRVGE
jgi:putative ABC transport system permease protein